LYRTPIGNKEEDEKVKSVFPHASVVVKAEEQGIQIQGGRQGRIHHVSANGKLKSSPS